MKLKVFENREICNKCGSGCCKNPNAFILLSEEDTKKIPKELQETFYDYSQIMKRTERGCAALGKNGCTIYSKRPFHCRAFPVVPVAYVKGQDAFMWGVKECPLSKEIPNAGEEIKKVEEALNSDKKLREKYVKHMQNLTEGSG